ncbi:DUF2584 family protein [Candidatus Pacearchaeota archaeon]|nr:DUF2584 family protein [Candidatus Pacearchaeota archaeon]MBI2056688.1 DUF2584 family protein [Candidatus Pacearchaeota archaeon]
MSFETKINWVLKLNRSLEGLSRGRGGSFTKQGYRIYPLNFPILLADKDWNVSAIIEIEEISQTKNETKGKYLVKRTLDDQEIKVLTNLYKKIYD